MDGHFSDFLIIGAGMAGLACATELIHAGAEVAVLDKGRGPGGGWRRDGWRSAGAVVSFDHGGAIFHGPRPCIPRDGGSMASGRRGSPAGG